MQGASVFRDDGTRGTVVSGQAPGRLVVEFGDGSSAVVSPEDLVPRGDGSYRISVREKEEELTIPVVAEELTVETARVARGRVRVHKRVETREESVDTPVIREEVVYERIPVNKFVDEEPPGVREEEGVLIIPVIEEVLVVEKRLLVREEVRVSKRRTKTSTPQTFTLRREVVDIEREKFSEDDAAKQ